MQAQWEQIQQAEREAYAILPSQPAEAYRLLNAVRERTHALYQTYGNWLPLKANDVEAFQRNGMGMCAVQLGRLRRAQEHFEQALALLDEDHFSRPGILRGLADVEFQQGHFDEAALRYRQASEAAAAQAQEAYDRYVRNHWVTAVQAQIMNGTSAYFQGDRAAYLRALDEATETARAQRLEALERQVLLLRFRHRLYTDPTGESFDAARQELAQRNDLQGDKGFQVDLLLLEIECRMQSGTFVGLESKLQKVYALAQGDINKEWAVLITWADVCRAQADSLQKPWNTTLDTDKEPVRQLYRKAVERAEQALQTARTSEIVMLTAAALRTLIPLRVQTGDPAQIAQADREQEGLRALGVVSELATALLLRAQAEYAAQQYEQALQRSLEAERLATTREQRQQAAIAQLAVFQALGRKQEALAAALRALDLFKEQAAPNAAASVTEWQALLDMVETLHNAVAGFKAEEGNLREAFAWAEAGKVQRLRRLLAQGESPAPAGEEQQPPAPAAVSETSASGFPPSAASAVPVGEQANGVGEPVSEASCEQVHAMLRSEEAGMVMFCVIFRQLLLLILDPHEPEPQAVFIDVSGNDLTSALKASVAAESPEAAASALFEVTAWLSSKIMPPLEEIVRHSKVLYIVPPAQLFAVPFAALTFEDGTPLVEHCAPVLVPSAAVLQWCRARRPQVTEPTCLAVGIGEEQNFSFADMAAGIAAKFPPGRSRLMTETAAGPFLAAAKDFSVLHVCCHGELDSQMRGTLSSSVLKFNGGDMTARDVFALPPWSQVELVFLNACVSGTFRLWARGEIGGFQQAFLHAGVPTLIATYVAVHPEHAGQMAERFYDIWLRGGVTKAEALQCAQREMHRRGMPPQEWATHFLIGDHR
jgi:CHAT domain-containing protein/tetratricopeptide (TPR) repeat protein